MKKVTIQDVAKELNLSRNTVAKALNNDDAVAYETRYLVLEQALKMGYSKLSPAVLSEFNLKKELEAKTIVVIARREISMFWNSIIMGISDELNIYRCKLQFNFVSIEDEVGLVLPLDLESHVDGIIILSVFSAKYIDKIIKSNVPIVFLDSPSDLRDVSLYGDVVMGEGRNSVRTITQSLLKQGLTKIGFIGDISYCKSIKDRYEGYCTALSSAGVNFDESIVATYHTDRKFYAKEEVEDALNNMAYIPEAVVCANDDIALYLISVLKDKGLSVPYDVAVTGYDDTESMSQIEEPFLTTIRIANLRLGRRLVQVLMWRLDNLNFPNEITYVGSEVIFRQSSNKISI